MVTHEAWSLRDVKTIYHMKDGVITETEHITKDKTVAESLSKNLFKQLSSTKTEGNKGNKEGEKSAEKEGEKIEQLSAHLLSNFLLRGYTMEENQRFENILNDLFNEKIDVKKFKELISKPFDEGGVGLWKKKTESISAYLKEIMEKRKDIESIYHLIEKNPEAPVFDEIYHIRDWLIKGYTGELTPWQVMSLDQVISDRIHNLITEAQVPDLLDLSKNKFGVGLSFRAAHLMAEKLELILNNGTNIPPSTENSNSDSQISKESAEDIANVSLKKL